MLAARWKDLYIFIYKDLYVYMYRYTLSNLSFIRQIPFMLQNYDIINLSIVASTLYLASEREKQHIPMLLTIIVDETHFPR